MLQGVGWVGIKTNIVLVVYIISLFGYKNKVWNRNGVAFRIIVTFQREKSSQKPRVEAARPFIRCDNDNRFLVSNSRSRLWLTSTHVAVSSAAAARGRIADHVLALEMRLFVRERELIPKEVMAFASQAEGEREDGRELATRQVQLSVVVHFKIPP